MYFLPPRGAAAASQVAGPGHGQGMPGRRSGSGGLSESALHALRMKPGC